VDVMWSIDPETDKSVPNCWGGRLLELRLTLGVLRFLIFAATNGWAEGIPASGSKNLNWGSNLGTSLAMIFRHICVQRSSHTRILAIKIEIPSPQFFDRPCQMPDRGLEDEFPLKFYLSSGSMLKNRGGYIQAPRNAGLFRIYVWVVSSKTPREDHHTCIMQPPRSKAPILTVVLKYHVQTWQWKIHNFWMIYP